jgi:hypothetical protein
MMIAAVALTVVIGATAAPHVARALTVPIDESAIVRTSAPIGSVVVSNPSIADVTVVDARRVAVLGRGYGMTNLIVLDRMGRPIMQQRISVAPAQSGRVSLYRGPLVYNFACSPRCERTPMPGEDKAPYEGAASSYKDYDQRAKSGATPSGSSSPLGPGG